MIRIIKDGSKKYTTTCESCGCVFEYQAEDVTKRTAWDDHGGHYPVCDFYEIKCPYCGRMIEFDSKDEVLREESKMKHIDA